MRDDGLTDTWSVVHDAAGQQLANDKALVLQSVGIPYRLVATERLTFAIEVPAPLAERARHELWEYDVENTPVSEQPLQLEPDYRAAIPGVAIYLVVVVFVAWLADISALGRDWLGAGRVDGALVREGEWWRLLTALTLHGGIKHILGNLVFGCLFGLFAGGLLGPGVAWLAIVVAGAAGNVLNVFFLDPAHRSIGASTAVFAALGIVSGFVWRARLMTQERWAWRLGPIVGGMALLAYTGTGGPNTDVGAHLLGFAAGFGSGLLLARIPHVGRESRLQLVCGVLALALIFIAWTIGLAAWQ